MSLYVTTAAKGLYSKKSSTDQSVKAREELLGCHMRTSNIAVKYSNRAVLAVMPRRFGTLTPDGLCMVTCILQRMF